jgi:Protein of unknown function (DUF4019)
VKLAALALTVILMLMFLPQILSTHAEQKPEDLAQKSAEAWLALTDSGKYAESWDQASSFFQSKVTKEKWVGMLESTRDPLGALQSRKLTSASYKKNPPNAPEGEYVRLTYDTSFDKLPSAIETVSTTLDRDGKWRAAGYFIKPAVM